MYAIVEIAGSQYRVQASDVVDIPSVAGNIGDEVSLGRILAVEDGGEFKLGAPYIEGTVTAKITHHGKGEKQIVFKKKRRKGYRVKNGHKQPYTTVEISNISVN